VPVIVSAAIQTLPLKEVARYVAVTCVTALAVTLPFWLHDPAVFWVACVTEQNYAAVNLNSILPHADLALPLASLAFAVGISFRRLKKWDADLLTNCALVQAFPVLAVILLASIEARRLDLSYAGYGVHFTFFGALASWNGFVRRPPCARDVR
jgi:hypothetical protein